VSTGQQVGPLSLVPYGVGGTRTGGTPTPHHCCPHGDRAGHRHRRSFDDAAFTLPLPQGRRYAQPPKGVYGSYELPGARTVAVPVRAGKTNAHPRVTTSDTTLGGGGARYSPPGCDPSAPSQAASALDAGRRVIHLEVVIEG
jgi:hypothetical protein